jgi:pimeloyl-ACP methyl ester carboxylesterase
MRHSPCKVGVSLRITVNGSKLYYVDLGSPSRPTIVLIHGFPLSSEMWGSQVQALKSRYRVIAFDLRGQGRSSAGDGQFTLEFLVDDLVAILDKLRVESAILCGLSMGGYVSLRAIERNTDRVSGLILCDTRSEADTNEGKLTRAATIRAINKDGVNAFARRFLKDAFSPRSLSDTRLVNTATKIISKNKPLGLRGTLLALAARTDTTSFLPKIKVPTLILVGEADKITPPDFSQRMHSSIQNSELHLVANAGHLSNMENLTDFNAYLLNFLDRKIRA